jgi:hypothetical protein
MAEDTESRDEQFLMKLNRRELVAGLIAWGIIGLLVLGWFALSPESRSSALEIPRRVLYIVQRVGDIALQLLGAIWESSAVGATARGIPGGAT